MSRLHQLVVQVQQYVDWRVEIRLCWGLILKRYPLGTGSSTPVNLRYSPEGEEFENRSPDWQLEKRLLVPAPLVFRPERRGIFCRAGRDPSERGPGMKRDLLITEAGLAGTARESPHVSHFLNLSHYLT